MKFHLLGDGIYVDKEQDTLDHFEEQVQKTRSVLHRLEAIKSAPAQIADLIMDLDVLDSKLRDNPNKDYSVSIAPATDNLQNIKSILAHSTIASDHRVRTKYRAYSSRIVDIASFDKVSTFTSDSLSTNSCSKTKRVQLPKISLPSFNGDLMQWTTFWNQFQTIVHNNDDLDTFTKLAYLRVSIKDPHIHALLCSRAETDEHYDEMIATHAS